MRQERAFKLRGFQRMETPSTYRTFAERCERMAKEATSPHDKEILEEMAYEWRRLAQEFSMAGTS